MKSNISASLPARAGPLTQRIPKSFISLLVISSLTGEYVSIVIFFCADAGISSFPANIFFIEFIIPIL
jgi:hypothetical protein